MLAVLLDIIRTGGLQTDARTLRDWCGSPRAAAAIILIVAAVYLPGFFTIPAVDRDECRFAQASRQMLESGDWIVPKVQGRERLNKPPLIYWLQAGSAWIATGGNPARDAIWMYRIPSLAAVFAVALLTWRWGRSLYDPRAAFLGAILIALSPVFWWEGRQARADMVLVACTTGALWMLWEIRRGRGGWRVAVFWTAVAAGVMVKGPVTPLVAAFAAAGVSVLHRDWRWLRRLRPLVGLALVVLISAPWFIAVGERIGWERYLRVLYNETLGRSVAPMEGHSGPPLYHAALVWFIFWPGALLLGLALWRAARLGVRRARAARPAEAFLLGAAVPSWIFFELVSTKLPHYTMPVFPLLALLCARTLFWVLSSAPARAAVTRPLLVLLVRGWSALGIGLWLAVCAFVAWAVSLGLEGRLTGPESAWLICAILLPVAAIPIVWFGARTYRPLAAGRLDVALHAGLGIFVLSVLTLGVTFPRLAPLWISRRLADRLAEIAPSHDVPVACGIYQEDSLIFETRASVRRLDEGSLFPWIAEHPEAILILPAHTTRMLPGWVTLAEVSGFNYSKGRFMTIRIGRWPAAPGAAQ